VNQQRASIASLVFVSGRSRPAFWDLADDRVWNSIYDRGFFGTLPSILLSSGFYPQLDAGIAANPRTGPHCAVHALFLPSCNCPTRRCREKDESVE